MHFCEVVARVYARFSRPRNASLNWFMPALVKSSVGSSPGTSEELDTMVCPWRWKYSRKLRRMSLERMSLCSVLIDRLSAPVAAERRGDPGGGEALAHEELINARRFLLAVQPGSSTQFPAQRIVDERPLVELAVDLAERL